MPQFKAIIKQQKVIRANKTYIYPIIKPVNFDPRLLNELNNTQINIIIPKKKL